MKWHGGGRTSHVEAWWQAKLWMQKIALNCAAFRPAKATNSSAEFSRQYFFMNSIFPPENLCKKVVQLKYILIWFFPLHLNNKENWWIFNTAPPFSFKFQIENKTKRESLKSCKVCHFWPVWLLPSGEGRTAGGGQLPSAALVAVWVSCTYLHLPGHKGWKSASAFRTNKIQWYPETV